MNRRTFLLTASAGVGAISASSHPVIRRARISLLTGRFHKTVAMNAYDKEPKGPTYQHAIIRLETDQGVEGIGAGTYQLDLNTYADALQFLVGKNPLDLYEMERGSIARAAPPFVDHQRKYQYLDGPLFDLIGKLTKKPAWALLGPAVRNDVDCYDGTLYFSDVMLPARGVSAVADECKEAVNFGFRAVKLKAGRGSKWMERKAGDERDIAIIHAARKAVGPDVLIMVDPNFGYDNDFDGAWRLLEETKADNVYWLEQPFRASVDLYTRLKDKMAAAGIKTLIADGENLKYADQFAPYLKPRRLVDVLQLDSRGSGFLSNRQAAADAEAVGAVSIPHNWASQIGHMMALHMAKACKAVTWSEDDRSTCDVFTPVGYKFGGPKQTVSNEPGLGIEINASVYEKQCRPNEKIFS
jgi:L-alanine-DL-glutamate epimerase-like enolase superfamily enzyme